MSHRLQIFPLIILILTLPIFASAADLQEDAPPLDKPRAGDVSGTIESAQKITALSAVSRVTEKSYTPDKFDAATGKFTFKDLPGGARYDLCVTLADGRRLEGIDLDFVDANLLKLAALRRKQLGLAAEEPHAFTRSDAKELLDYAAKADDFLDIRRPLYVQGHGRRATMLVELMRTREFYSSNGAIIWRIELWYFEYRHGGWERLSNQERVLRRERIDPDKWRAISVEYFPELSVSIARNGTASDLKFKVPDKPDPSTGRPANSEPKLQTEPKVLGVERQDPTTQTN